MSKQRLASLNFPEEKRFKVYLLSTLQDVSQPGGLAVRAGGRRRLHPRGAAGPEVQDLSPLLLPGRQALFEVKIHWNFDAWNCPWHNPIPEPCPSTEACVCVRVLPLQVNTGAAEVLYSAVGEWAQLDQDSTVLDVCCGTGTIGISLAKVGNNACLDPRFFFFIAF